MFLDIISTYFSRHVGISKLSAQASTTGSPIYIQVLAIKSELNKIFGTVLLLDFLICWYYLAQYLGLKYEKFNKRYFSGFYFRLALLSRLGSLWIFTDVFWFAWLIRWSKRARNTIYQYNSVTTVYGKISSTNWWPLKYPYLYHICIITISYREWVHPCGLN